MDIAVSGTVYFMFLAVNITLIDIFLRTLLHLAGYLFMFKACNVNGLIHSMNVVWYLKYKDNKRLKRSLECIHDNDNVLIHFVRP